jgi:hypothetical protein
VLNKVLFIDHLNGIFRPVLVIKIEVEPLAPWNNVLLNYVTVDSKSSNSQRVVEPNNSLLYSQEPAIFACIERNKCSGQTYMLHI